MDLSGTCSDILTELRWGEDMAGGLLLAGVHRGAKQEIMQS